MTAVKTVKLTGVPVEAFVAIQRHIDELFRELQVIDVGRSSDTTPPRPELRDVMTRILTEYASARADALEQAAQALAQGNDRADVALELPTEAVAAIREFNDLLDRADDLCRRGDLLTLPESETEAKLRAWCMVELDRQLSENASPEPCPI